jgi:hypothetical protein
MYSSTKLCQDVGFLEVDNFRAMRIGARRCGVNMLSGSGVIIRRRTDCKGVAVVAVKTGCSEDKEVETRSESRFKGGCRGF